MRIDTQRYDKHHSLRLAEVFGDEADGLGTEILGMGALVATDKGFGQRLTAPYPRIQAVQRHMRIAVGEIEHSEFRLAVAASLCFFCHTGLTLKIKH